VEAGHLRMHQRGDVSAAIGAIPWVLLVRLSSPLSVVLRSHRVAGEHLFYTSCAWRPEAMNGCPKYSSDIRGQPKKKSRCQYQPLSGVSVNSVTIKPCVSGRRPACLFE